MIDEIKKVALRHLATDGSALSLRAVARDMGMVSSAVYRYFPSRDDLLTALIIDAYDSMGEAAEKADASIPDRSDVLLRWLTLGRALRDWAVARPQEYALIYGSPIPGYAAPESTIEPASRPVYVMASIIRDAHEAGLLRAPDEPAPEGALGADLERAGNVLKAGTPPMARALAAWTQMLGGLNFELFGRLHNVISVPGDWFDWQLRSMAAYIGLEGKGPGT
jgi:AcrR family transcriptional regulator